jgi:hypothetical protein
VVTEEVATPATGHYTKCLDWRVAARVITYRRMEWAIDSLASYKSPGMDGIFLALLKEEQRIFVTYLVKIFHAWLHSSHMGPG